MKLNGSAIRDGRHKKGLTQTELAVAAGLSTATVVTAEKGGPLWPKTGRAICEFLGIDLAEVVVTEGDSGSDAA